MPTVQLKLPHHEYPIHIESGAIARLGDWLHEIVPHNKAAMFADAAVVDTHGKAVLTSLKSAGYQVLAGTIPSGEQVKNRDTVQQLYDAWLGTRLERRSPVVAVGGGVTGDTVGFAAATYLRGVPFVQCPTTLLAMVDASVGGKVGINVPQGKNLIGAFHQPSLVVIDTDTLRTLPKRELRCGLAECVKHAFIRDPGLLAWIEEFKGEILHQDGHALVELVTRNVQIKARVVMADEKEAGERAHLNFGHTFAHAIEATQTGGYGAAYHHGEAVSLGMVAATRLAVDTGRCDHTLLDSLEHVLSDLGLPIRATDLPPAATLIQAMQHDKKVADGKLRLILPERLGVVSSVTDVPEEAITKAWQSLGQ